MTFLPRDELLTLLMAKAMNRSVANVLFGAFGQVQTGAGGARADDGRTVRATTPEDVAVQLSVARKVIIVPGYGMAGAQAQHFGSDSRPDIPLADLRSRCTERRT